MLPDFPVVKKAQADNYNAYLERSIRGGDPFLKQIRHKKIHEGDRSVIEHGDGYVVDDPFQEFEATLEVKIQDVIEKGVEVFYEAAAALIEEMQEKQAKLIFQRIDESTQRTGNVVDGKGQDLAASFLEALERVQVEFDSDGNPELQVVVHPNMRDKMLKLMSDSTLRIQYEQLLSKKREEWRDRENNRKLVD